MNRGGLARRTSKRIARYLRKSLEAEELARQPGLLQSLDPRVKIVGLLSLVFAAAWTGRLGALPFIFAFALLLASFSRISLRILASRVWLSALFFTGLLALPSLFLVPGDEAYRLPLLGWTITTEGARSATFLLCRVETITTLSALLVLSTPWMQVLKSLRILRVPVVLVVILAMTYRYIVLLLQTALEMFEAREARTVGKLNRAEGRRIAATTAGVLLSKTLLLSEDVYLAMRSRGYRGEVYLLEDLHMRARDWTAMGLLAAFATLALAMG